MYIPDALKVNKFVSVKLPDNCSYFARFGYQAPDSQLYTGDKLAVLSQNKVDSIVDYQRYAKMMADEYNKSEK